MSDDFSPIYVSDTGAPFAPVFQHADSTPVSLSGASISMKMQLVAAIGAIVLPVGTILACAGAWTIDDAINGKAHYQYQSADVATAGVWQLFIIITIAGAPVHADMKVLEILPAP